MEHHHFDQCLMILNSPGNQILANLSSEDYCRVIKVLEDAILSTDLAVYLRFLFYFCQTSLFNLIFVIFSHSLSENVAHFYNLYKNNP